MAREDERARILDSLEHTAVLIKQSEGEADGYHAAYFLQEKDDEDVLNSSHLFLPTSTAHCMRLSDLGIQKCAQIFHRFDDDRDGVWGFVEFKAYVTVLRGALAGRDPLRVILQHEEVWNMYMSDLYETDSNGHLTLRGFCMYREATESINSLATDLICLGMHWLWDGLQRHIHLQRLFDSYDIHRAGKVPIHQLPYLLGESGVVTSQTQVDALVHHVHAHFACMDAILQRNRAIRLFGYKQLSRVNSCDTDHIYRDAFVAVRLSMWTPSPPPRWQQVTQRIKLRTFGWIRRAKLATTKVATWIQRAALTGLLNLTYLTGNADDNHSDRGDYVLKVDVGKDFAAHAELQLSYTADCDSSATLYNLGYREDGAECFVYLDFLTKADITDVELNDTIAAMSTLLDVGFHDHLQSLPWFHKALVVSPPKTHAHSGGGSGIVRVVILLTDALDPFNLLLFLGFPPSLQFDHLLSRLRWNAMLNVSLHDIFTNKRFNAAKHFALRSALNVCVGRQACGQTVQQACCQAKYESSARDTEDEIIRQELRQHSRHVTVPTPNKLDPRVALAWKDQSQRNQREGAGRWHEWAANIASFLKHAKTMNVNVHVATIADLIHGDSVLHTLFHRDTIKDVRPTKYGEVEIVHMIGYLCRPCASVSRQVPFMHCGPNGRHRWRTSSTRCFKGRVGMSRPLLQLGFGKSMPYTSPSCTFTTRSRPT
ncbi:hypothetical protein, variant 2 [Aphanomyces astaci]|uniref:EF-hand domain-containing protein n=3 Tax=Aphanomyces astaci TaxID=112090 RepID=W4H691_APHAT|nr:hypothetical protein, variant 2 [Aphanomyces astaci]ETV86628.1 hypothetical protein, variant 2 [Aphanomyces astaci]|eukprot:XP_009823426.1 hypothetical protein, variant 2 [Aphanomyces astaci]